MLGAADSPIRLRDRLTVRLTAGVVLALLLVGCPFFVAFHRLMHQQQIEALTEATDGLSRVVVDGLRAAMLAHQPHLLDETVQRLSDGAEVERVMLLDHRGRVRVSSDAAYAGRSLDRGRESACRVCHRADRDSPRTRTSIATHGDRRVFRTMTVIANEPRCHSCHDARASSNGILLIDLALDSADRRFFTGIGSTLALGTVMALLTIAVLALLLRRMVHNPLRTIVASSQRVVEGDLAARATLDSRGEFGQLASQVNRMTDHLAESLGTVENQRRDLQSILDAVDDEIVVLDRERRVVAANAAFRRRQPAVEATGRPCHEVSAAHCAGNGEDGCPVVGVFETGKLSKGMVTWTEPDGRERVVEIHASPLRASDGSVSRAVEVRRDISERRQLEAVLAHSEHLASLGLLASGLSHEINNPLGAIATSVEGLRRRLASEPGIAPQAAANLERALRRIGEEVERGRTITHRLLRVARPSGGSRSLVDVNHVVEDTVGILSHDIKRFGIRTHLQLGDDLPPLLGDETRFSQMVMNVTLNAVQAMAEHGGDLHISTTAVDGTVRLTVEDTGCGIPAEILRKIYEPFFTTKPVGKGTGLGLFITHQLVTDVGGTIEVRSQSGRGTTFVLQLPRRARTDEPG